MVPPIVVQRFRQPIGGEDPRGTREEERSMRLPSMGYGATVVGSVARDNRGVALLGEVHRSYGIDVSLCDGGTTL